MVEYKVRVVEHEGTGELEDACNGMAPEGWRLVSTSTLDCLDALRIAESHERVWCTAGVHPSYSDVGDSVKALVDVYIWDYSCMPLIQ